MKALFSEQQYIWLMSGSMGGKVPLGVMCRDIRLNTNIAINRRGLNSCRCQKPSQKQSRLSIHEIVCNINHENTGQRNIQNKFLCLQGDID